jgi:hypothetical protein
MSKQSRTASYHEFHRHRAEAEMERAVAARKPTIAMIHLELARQHRERRNQLAADQRPGLRPCAPRCFNGTDKEG